jgi:hypothetical protein
VHWTFAPVGRAIESPRWYTAAAALDWKAVFGH